MASRPVLFGRTPTRQKAAQILIDDSFVKFMKGNPLKQKAFFKEVDRHFRRALVIGAESVKRQISAMRAIGSGFMRNSVIFTMEANADKNPMIQGKIGTMAWYDILVHKGLGRHGGSKTIPSEYRPSEAQKAIIEPDEETRMSEDFRKLYWKESQGIPRPFLTIGINNAKKAMAKEVMAGVRKGMKALRGSGRGGIPKHDISEVLFGGTLG